MRPAPSDVRRLVIFDWTLLAAIIVFTVLPIGLSFERLLNPPAFEYQRGWGDTLAMLHPVALVVSPVVAWKRWWWLGAACLAVAGGAAVSGVHRSLEWEAGAGSLGVAIGYLVLFAFCVGRQAVHTRLAMDSPGLVTFEKVAPPEAATPIQYAADRITDGALATIGIAGSAVSAFFGFLMALYPSGPLPILIAMLSLGVVGALGIRWSWARHWLRAGLTMLATPVAWLLINEGVLLEFTLIYPVLGLVMFIRYGATSRQTYRDAGSGRGWARENQDNNQR